MAICNAVLKVTRSPSDQLRKDPEKSLRYSCLIKGQNAVSSVRGGSFLNLQSSVKSGCDKKLLLGGFHPRSFERQMKLRDIKNMSTVNWEVFWRSSMHWRPPAPPRTLWTLRGRGRIGFAAVRAEPFQSGPRSCLLPPFRGLALRRINAKPNQPSAS